MHIHVVMRGFIWICIIRNELDTTVLSAPLHTLPPPPLPSFTPSPSPLYRSSRSDNVRLPNGSRGHSAAASTQPHDVQFAIILFQEDVATIALASLRLSWISFFSFGRIRASINTRHAVVFGSGTQRYSYRLCHREVHVWAMTDG